jgi:class 3 adenylate cyclase
MSSLLSRLFVGIPPEYKDDFLKEINHENINRLITLGIAISVLEGITILVINEPARAPSMALVIGFNLIFLPFLWWFKRSKFAIGGMAGQWVTFIGFTAYLLFGSWLVLSGRMQFGASFDAGRLSPYTIAAFGVASAFFLSPSLSLAGFVLVGALFVFGLYVVEISDFLIKPNLFNSAIMNTIAWLISRMLFRFRLDAFLARRRIEQEQQRSEALLLNVLPAKVAQELKERGRTTPERFESVTVFFSDLVNFTSQSTRLSPDVLIRELNELFTAFDEIIEKYDCERIKTIGDAYLCVCGMPESHPAHTRQVVGAAIDILKYLEERNRHHSICWTLRIGIHTGSLVGGVVGVKKYIYDIFGDTVNTASRMESHSVPMKINLSEEAYRLVRHDFSFTERAPEYVKGKGLVKMYFLEV